MQKGMQALILYGTVLGLARSLSNKLEGNLSERVAAIGDCRMDVRVKNVASYDPEDLEKEAGCYVIVVMSTYADGSDPPSAAPFCKWICEAQDDFRVGKGFLKDLGGFAVYGLGDTAYPSEDFCSASRRLSSGFANLGAFQLLPDVERDASCCSENCDDQVAFQRWCNRLVNAMTQQQKHSKLLQSSSSHTKAIPKQLIQQPNGMQKRREQEVIVLNDYSRSSLLFASLCWPHDVYSCNFAPPPRSHLD